MLRLAKENMLATLPTIENPGLTVPMLRLEVNSKLSATHITIRGVYRSPGLRHSLVNTDIILNIIAILHNLMLNPA